MQKNKTIKKYLKNTWASTKKILTSIKGGFLNKNKSSSSKNDSKTSKSSKSSKSKKLRKSSKNSIVVKSSSGLLPFQLNK